MSRFHRMAAEYAAQLATAEAALPALLAAQEQADAGGGPVERWNASERIRKHRATMERLANEIRSNQSLAAIWDNAPKRYAGR